MECPSATRTPEATRRATKPPGKTSGATVTTTLAKEREIPLYEDLGSGAIIDLKPFGLHEPRVEDSIRAGVDLISFSTDKLLGGPQSGILAGRPDLIARLRRNPMFRAFRVDKLICQALETTLRCLLLGRWQDIPALQMLSHAKVLMQARAEQFQSRIKGYKTELIEGESVVGGGAMPAQSLPTILIAINEADPVALEKRLRKSNPPVIARIESNRLVIDLRTVLPNEEEDLLRAIGVHQC